MDFSKLKLDIYDILGILMPGLIVICEGWVFLRGWPAFVASLNQLGGTGFTLLTIVGFGVGHLVQEFGDFFITTWKGSRYFRRSRDQFWASEEAKPIKAAIQKELGSEVAAVDTAFDYCLTKLKDRFGKRDVFIATSDLSRSLAIVLILAVVPAARLALHNGLSDYRHVALFGTSVAFLVSLALLSWRRMVRFRDLSEVTVFRAYLATVRETNKE